MKTMSDKPKETLDQKIVRYHAKFLEAIKETYPLAVLGSLCITIAAFTTNTYPDVQTYALAAASLLLFSFGFSFIMKFLPSSYFAICSYVSAGLGAIFIYLVLSSFMKYIPIISRSLGLVTNVAVIFTELSFLYFVYVFGKRQRSFRMNRILDLSRYFY
jgi:hypothetical protein